MFDQIGVKFLVIISLIFIILWSIYRYMTRNFDYWTSRGIKGPKPFILFGSTETFYKTARQQFLDQYKTYGRIYGTFFGDKPILVVSEPTLIKDIFIKDFHIFVERNDLVTGDPINDRQLFNAHGDEWKQLRSVISPTFSSGKMRKMHPLIEDCVKSVEELLMRAANQKQEVELKKLMGNYTLDVIASCAFATKIDAHNDPNSPFIKNGEKVFNFGLIGILKFMIAFSLPSLATKLKLSIFDKTAQDFFVDVIRSIIKRRKTESKKNVDFLQLMIDTQKKVNLEDIEEKTAAEDNSIFDQSDHQPLDNKSYSKVELSETDILANAFLFFIAGYETTATLLTFLCYSLALHDNFQQKLYEELKNAEKLDYDTISRLPYLDACVAETQRVYNSIPGQSRIPSQDYKLGDTGITVSKGTLVQINVDGIHHDPHYYPNPTRFDPERFMPENRDKLVPYTFLPFGIGPRNCVGMRFALMEAKTAIAHIITKFKFVRTANTEIPVQFKKFAFFLTPKNMISVGVELRKS